MIPLTIGVKKMPSLIADAINYNRRKRIRQGKPDNLF
jgi:hypothetical protein